MLTFVELARAKQHAQRGVWKDPDEALSRSGSEHRRSFDPWNCRQSGFAAPHQLVLSNG
jgi:hypothetical protein